MTTIKTYAQFNTLTIVGRVYHKEDYTYQGKELTKLILATELKNDGESYRVEFTIDDRQMAEYFTKGRYVTVTGHLNGVEEIFFDKKVGKTRRHTMPLLKLSKVQVMPGGYGAVKKQEEATSDDIIDMAPDLDSVETAEAKPAAF
jgi:hypothetical protein